MTLQRPWSVGGVAATDDVMFDLTSHLLESKDFKRSKVNAAEAPRIGKPRPYLDFEGASSMEPRRNSSS
jgi:hypothetical protein